jgi:alpha-D-xyloside xylohydrolase
MASSFCLTIYGRMQYADEKPANPIELRVYHGADGSFSLDEDDGE